MNRLHRLLIVSLTILPCTLFGCSDVSTGNKSKNNKSSNSKSETSDQTASDKRLEGAGSTFINPMMQEWSKIYNKEKGIEVNYQSGGSGAGIKMMTKQDVDFGCTDAPMKETQLEEAKKVNGDVVHIPLVMGGVVPAYNLPGSPEIKFTGKVLGDIYLGKIVKWNDSALKELNPDVKLPDLSIDAVHRSEGSGTTFIWTEFLSKTNKDWNKGKGTDIAWPIGGGEKGTDGVAGHIKQTPGSIGYVELIYALMNDIPYGSVQNKAGKFIKADMKSVTAAAEAILKDIPEDLRYSLTDAPGEDAYPIAGTTWAVLYTHQPADKAKTVVDFLRWVTHEGQAFTEKLHYAKLPEGLVKRLDQKLDQVTGGK